VTPIAHFAPAKINLSLHVLGKRADGYHALESLVVFAGVGDRITVQPADALCLSVTGPMRAGLAGLPDTDNLVLRAAHLLDGGAARGAHITLEKHLPVAAGIGGGSADCAATLRALTQLWGLGHDLGALAEMGAALGADVPVCLYAPHARVMSGIGEVIAPAPLLPAFWCVLVNPGVPVATGAVFQALAAGAIAHEGGTFWPGRFENAHTLARFLATCRNDLEAPARKLVPEVDQVLQAISTTGGCLLTRMSGSGATCFGLYASETDAHAAAHALECTDWWVMAAPVCR